MTINSEDLIQDYLSGTRFLADLLTYSSSGCPNIEWADRNGLSRLIPQVLRGVIYRRTGVGVVPC
jgi:hypothetical protein